MKDWCHLKVFYLRQVLMFHVTFCECDHLDQGEGLKNITDTILVLNKLPPFLSFYTK